MRVQEAEWEAMRNALESQIRAQGGYVSLSPPPLPPPPDGEGQQQHQDYAAQTGSGVFHPTRSGLRERFIDSAEDLEFEGVVDPNGRAHLAQLLGHLYDIKLVSSSGGVSNNSVDRLYMPMANMQPFQRPHQAAIDADHDKTLCSGRGRTLAL